MIIRRNLIRGIGASLIGLSTYNILKPASAAKSYKIEEENICNSDDFVVNHEPINDVTETQLAAVDDVVHMLNVGPNGSRFRYDPMLSEIDVGGKILWKATTKGHNVEFLAGPDGWEIPKRSKMNNEYSYKFEIPGIYFYQCTPHKGMGMIALVVVGGDTSNKEAIAKVKVVAKAKKKLPQLLGEL